MLQEDSGITKTIETIALEKFGSTADFRKVLESLNATPFSSDLLPEFETFNIEMIQNPEELNARINEAKEKIEQITNEAEILIKETTDRITQAEETLKNSISKINWLF